MKRQRMTVDESESRVAPRRTCDSVTFHGEVELQPRKGVGLRSVASRAYNSEKSAAKVSAPAITAIIVEEG